MWSRMLIVVMLVVFWKDAENEKKFETLKDFDYEDMTNAVCKIADDFLAKVDQEEITQEKLRDYFETEIVKEFKEL